MSVSGVRQGSRGEFMSRKCLQVIGFSVATLTQAIPVAQAQPRHGRPGPPPPRGPVIINNYENNNAGAGLAASALGFGAGLLMGSATRPVPPPPSTVIVTQPAPVIAQPLPSTVVQVQAPPSDAVGAALKQLNSHWASTRRDAAILLGRQRATQAVGPLMDRLRNDKDASVRKTAAWSLAEIGDTTALEYLEKTSQFDKSPEVRAAAKTAYQRLVEKVAIATPTARPVGLGATRDPLAPTSAPPVPGASPPLTRQRAAQNPTRTTAPRTSLSPFSSSNSNINTTPVPEPGLSLSPPIEPLSNP